MASEKFQKQFDSQNWFAYMFWTDGVLR